jgi:hypothetical protein
MVRDDPAPEARGAEENSNGTEAAPDRPVIAESLLRIGRSTAALLDDATLVVDHGDLLYGPDGLRR